MPPNHESSENLNFAEFLAAQMREKGLSPKRLAENTGIAPAHLESMLRGNLENMPPSPYFRGYLVRLGKTLGFDGEEWWRRIKKENLFSNAGSTDALPENRFEKKEFPKWIWLAGAGALIMIIYLSFALPRILGKPSVAITFPATNPYVTSMTSINIQGIAKNADALYLGNGDVSSSATIAIAPDGTWQQTVLLESGLNTFEFHAKKFLGGEERVMEQVLYEPTNAGTSTASTTP